MTLARLLLVVIGLLCVSVSGNEDGAPKVLVDGGDGEEEVSSTTSTGTGADTTKSSSSSSSSSFTYGVDVSWPIHHHLLHDEPLIDRLDEYHEFMDGCFQHYSKKSCQTNEDDRVAMNLRQPRVQINYTHAGYAKVPIPAASWQLLQEVWNNHQSKSKPEYWEEGNIYVNHWASPTSYLALDRFLTMPQRKQMLQQVQDVLQSWTQTTLVPTSLYGIRVYHRHSVLAPHIDRMPLVVSAILNVAQNVEQDWVLEVYGHNGQAVNVTIQPGEMILYESASVIHGRPFPLQGEYYANVFAHFEPVGYTQALEQRLLRTNNNGNNNNKIQDAKTLFERALEKASNAFSSSSKKEKHKHLQIPNYLLTTREDGDEDDDDHDDSENAILADRWKQNFVFLREYPSKDDSHSGGSGSGSPRASNQRAKGVTSAHVVAANGNLEQLKEVEKQKPEALLLADSNGWKPIHEAARAGKTDMVEYLLKKGADVNERTNSGNGANAMWWAQHALPENHPTIVLLRQHGGVPIGPYD